MPKLSILVPVENDTHGLSPLLGHILADTSLDLEVLVASRGVENLSEALADHAADERLIQLHPLSPDTPIQTLWNQLVKAANGDWLALFYPDDIVEPELAIMVAFLETANKDVDALAWNALSIDPDFPRETRLSVAIPTQAAISNFDKTVMLKSFFMWDQSTNSPNMPFGLYHGAIRKTLAVTIADSLNASGRLSPLPRFEWAARVLFLSNALAFSSRPMSVISKEAYRYDPLGKSSAHFPFNAAMGLTAGIGEVQHAVFAEMGSSWGAGAQDAFVKACMYDCMTATTEAAFTSKYHNYMHAIKAWNALQYAAQYTPAFQAEQYDTRRGLQGSQLLVDRFVGQAQTAQDFYRVIRSFLIPVPLICGGVVA